MDFSEELLSERTGEILSEEVDYDDDFSIGRFVGGQAFDAGLYWDLACDLFNTWMKIFKGSEALAGMEAGKREGARNKLEGHNARLRYQLMFFWDTCSVCGVQPINKRWLMVNADSEEKIKGYWLLCLDRESMAADVISLTECVPEGVKHDG